MVTQISVTLYWSNKQAFS